MFQIKSFDSIVASAINNAAALSDELTDFNIGSVTRTIIEAVAREIDQAYQQLLKGLYEATPVALYKSLNFQRLKAQTATGFVTFYRKAGFEGDIIISKGTKVGVPNTNLTYSTVDRATMKEGEGFVTVLVIANDTEGAGGNTGAYTITELIDEIEGIIQVSNHEKVDTGVEDESEVERKNRFQKYVNSLSRATERALEYGACQAYLKNSDGVIVERCLQAVCLDLSEKLRGNYHPGGYAELYVWNGVNGASGDLIREVEKVLVGYTDKNGIKVEGWKSAGSVIMIRRIVPVYVDTHISVKLENGYILDGVKNDVEDVVNDYFDKLKIGDPVVWGRLEYQLLDIKGIWDIEIEKSQKNIEIAWNRICVRGVYSLKEMS
jgi:uncharacterized phage protein gp47/JayE